MNRRTLLFDEISLYEEPEKQLNRWSPSCWVIGRGCTIFFIVREGMFYSLETRAFTNQATHPHYIAVNFV